MEESSSSSSSYFSSTSRPKSRVFSSNNNFQRSISPSGRFCSSSISSYSSGLLTRPTSPTRVKLYGSLRKSSSPSIRFSTPPTRSSSSISYANHKENHKANDKSAWNSRTQKKTCACSPTTHPGSFRCGLHKKKDTGHRHYQTASYQSNGLAARRSAMTNSLVRIGAVEGEWEKRALAALIRPSSHHQRRNFDFQPRPSRFLLEAQRLGDNCSL